jgi:hypothetical protein
MAARPYFSKGITELEELFQQNKGNKAVLEVLEHELKHRDRPKAKELEKATKKCLTELMGNGLPAIPTVSVVTQATAATRQVADNPVHPSRVSVECGHCGEANYVSTLEGVTQHLSCSACKTPYEAVFKYSVLRTKFPPKQAEKPATNYGLIALVLIAITATALFFFKK